MPLVQRQDSLPDEVLVEVRYPLPSRASRSSHFITHPYCRTR
jgi:hypothetical protein